MDKLCNNNCPTGQRTFPGLFKSLWIYRQSHGVSEILVMQHGSHFLSENALINASLTASKLNVEVKNC